MFFLKIHKSVIPIFSCKDYYYNWNLQKTGLLQISYYTFFFFFHLKFLLFDLINKKNTYHNIITLNPRDNSLQPFFVLTVLETRIYVVDELIDHFNLEIKTILIAAFAGKRTFIPSSVDSRVRRLRRCFSKWPSKVNRT